MCAWHLHVCGWTRDLVQVSYGGTTAGRRLSGLDMGAIFEHKSSAVGKVKVNSTMDCL